MMCSGEVQNPRRVIPSATRQIYIRLGMFYILGTLALGIICDAAPDSELVEKLALGGNGSAISPWVIGLQSHGVNGLANLVNALVLTSAWSCGNAYVYSATRTLYALALNNKAPAIFKKCNKAGVPIMALAVVAAISCLTFLNASNSTTTVLNWFINLATVSFLLVYMVIFYTYICFRRAYIAQQGSTDGLPFRTPFGIQPWVSWLGMSMCFIIAFFNGFYIFWPGAFNAADFISSYFGLMIFPFFYAFWKIFKRTKVVKPEDADLWSGKVEIDDEEAEFVREQAGLHRSWYQRALDFIF